MGRLHLRLGLLFVLLALVPGMAEAEPFRRTTLTILADGARYHFEVELAETAAQRGQGLQGRHTLPANGGMLFDFKNPQPVAMWMKNTPIPLDMAFIRADGVIEGIAADTVPQSLDILRSEGEVLGVLEVNAGSFARLGIRPGHRVLHWLFDPTRAPRGR